GSQGGVTTHSVLPAQFLWLGQGFLGGVIPAQAPWLAVIALAYWLLLHRSVRGRTYFAIGNNAAASRFAGVPVPRRLLEIYLPPGTLRALAAIIYVAHLGQAKADAGTGYELVAVTAVVLGGTAITGGRG